MLWYGGTRCRNVIFFQPRDDLRSYVNVGKSHNLINDSITKWQVFEPTLHWGFQTVEISYWNVENRQNVILNNVDYLCKGIKDEVLRGGILEVVLSVTIKDANAVAICACVAELMI